jgi:hypothetical protein
MRGRLSERFLINAELCPEALYANLIPFNMGNSSVD